MPRAVTLCSLAVLVAFWLHLPFVIFPGSLLPIHHAGYNVDAHLGNSNLSESDNSLGRVHLLPPVSNAPQRKHSYIHRRQDNEAAYQASITKGWGLRCLMDATVEEASIMIQNSPKWKTFHVESEFIDPLMAPLEWGWDVKTLDLKDATEILSDYRIEEMLEFLHVSTDLRFWTQQLVKHEREWFAEDGRMGPVCDVVSPVYIFVYLAR